MDIKEALNPNTRMVLRFRDLVTDLGGTISEHQSIVRTYGEAWWGWMMRHQERPPRDFFCRLKQLIVANGTVDVLLYDTGENNFHRCKMHKLVVAPHETRIGTPDPQKTPEYYNRGRYPAWFCFTSITKMGFEHGQFFYDSFPTKTQGYEQSHIGSLVNDLEELRHQDVTLWVFRERHETWGAQA